MLRAVGFCTLFLGLLLGSMAAFGIWGFAAAFLIGRPLKSVTGAHEEDIYGLLILLGLLGVIGSFFVGSGFGPDFVRPY